MAKAKKIVSESIEITLWKAADKLRKNIDAAEYKHVVLGLVFLKYISDSFEERYAELQNEEWADPEDKDEYLESNIFFVPAKARWSYLLSNAKLPEIGKLVDEAMDEIEKENNSLKGVLPKVYARDNLNSTILGELIDIIGNISIGDTKIRSADVLGHVFEYFLGEFALAEGKQGGQFYTPKSVVELLVKMLEPYKGRVFDPCCGSGGMFVQSEKFVESHQGQINDISIYGQESNQTTWRLCKMNLAIRGIDSSQVKWNSDGSFLKDAHKDLKADYIIANPPFNISDWSGELLRNDARWQYGTPPVSNANYAWIQHFLYHLAPTGVAGFVLAKGALTSNTSGEGDIRKALVEANLVDCIVNLPAKLFLNTQIPASLWFIKRGRKTKDILFIDARNKGHLINRRTKEFSDDDITEIAQTYHNWKVSTGSTALSSSLSLSKCDSESHKYEDIKGFCKSASYEEVVELNYVLTPGRYVGLEEVEDDFNFAERFTSLKTQLAEQMQQEEVLNQRIMDNLAKITTTKLVMNNSSGLSRVCKACGSKLIDIDDTVEKALDRLYRRDAYLMDHRVNERTIVARFAVYFEQLLSHSMYEKYNLDIEYNKNHDNPKRTKNFKNGTYPDIILHKRGSNSHNICIFEFKTWWNNSVNDDIQKLKDFTCQQGTYKYKVGYSLILNRKRGYVKKIIIKNGKKL